MYVDYIHTYQELERSIRTNDINDIDLYVQSLSPIIGVFFAANHPNYCRWLTKFQLDLINMENTHPGLRDILDSGAFGIRRTEHPFSRCAVDLTLEQTINADAASRLTGISAFTNNFAARLRWIVTKSTRAKFVSLVQEMAGISQKDDTKAELKPSRIKRDKRDLAKIVEQIRSSCDPFESESSAKLFNIHTGKAASDEVCKSLLNVPNNGRALHQQFIEECLADEKRFERTVKQASLKTFAENGAKNKKALDRRVAVLKCTRDLMGRLVILAAQRELDLPHIFTYPLTPVPLTMCHPDEILVKTNKDSLLAQLEERQTTSSPESIAACVIDGQYLLRVLPPIISIPPHYGGLARSILSQAIAVRKTRQVFIAFDDYPQPSLKDAERARRVGTIEESQPYVITGPSQKRQKDLLKALESRSFKRELPVFLSREWQDNSYASVLGNCEVVLDVPTGDCFHYANVDGKVKSQCIPEKKSNHEEADTKIIRHAIEADKLAHKGNIVVRAHDTDVAVLLVNHCWKIGRTVWMDVGTVSKKNRRFINITEIQKSLGPGVCRSLPAFHAFTGSDYTSAFVKKGKVRPFVKYLKNTDVQKAFETIITKPNDDRSHEVLLKFTASIYGARENSKVSLNSHRYKRFETVYKPKMKGKNPLEKLKGIDASGLPPCEAEVMCHLKRVAFVSKMWADADKAQLVQHPSEDNGWTLENGIYTPIWFDGPQLPDSLVPEGNDCVDEIDDIVSFEAASSDEEDDDSDLEELEDSDKEL